jgi:hypothetical protein
LNNSFKIDIHFKLRECNPKIFLLKRKTFNFNESEFTVLNLDNMNKT